MTKIYREGPVGALMDEYERASSALAAIINGLSQSEYEKILDSQTENENCRSPQTIINHVIEEGYSYANSIRRATNQPEIEPVFQVTNAKEALIHFDKMLKYTVETLEDKWKMNYDDIFYTVVTASDGTKSNLEARLEAAIVHVLRHRRQLEKLLKLDT